MAVNADKPLLWKADVLQSIDLYNAWFMQFAPQVYRGTRVITAAHIESTLKQTGNLRNIEPALLRQYPNSVAMLRMVTAPPLARDRLIGLAGVSSNLVESMEKDNRIPPKMNAATVDDELLKIGKVILHLVDSDLFPWLERQEQPTEAEIYRSASVVADRLCGASSDPIIRNAQEQRQLALIKTWLEQQGYSEVRPFDGDFRTMRPGSFCFRLGVPGKQAEDRIVNIPIDAVTQPKENSPADFPLLIEAKSAGDFTNTNKRRKEEGIKMAQLRLQHGASVRFILFLCGYFDTGYLGYEAAEGIDWVWEHRIADLSQFGV